MIGSKVYPRMCGGTRHGRTIGFHAGGLSPRVRGNHQSGTDARRYARSIPACAGEPSVGNRCAPVRSVYPRVCGGTISREQMRAGTLGLSPRVRGNHQSGNRCATGTQIGSIPACAGEPSVGNRCAPVRSVYPRVCGGTSSSKSPTRRRSGLSPRVRGNPSKAAAMALTGWSIPACAGEPALISAICRTISGLSPRVRGNPEAVVDGVLGRGSIPACAGEPADRRHNRLCLEVYPRVCGGTSGPSKPRRWSLWSIPACAGEPRRRDAPVSPRWVYPRVCGGTRIEEVPDVDPLGLSPRVRGNRGPPHPRPITTRSIPACAGEPLASRRFDGIAEVYPRVCGGTHIIPCDCYRQSESRGLSPRVRGNLFQRRHVVILGGSIPACAGEPLYARGAETTRRVYPRVCGGTNGRILKQLEDAGLSPRVRGNHGLGVERVS